jgi:hypothetical protein
MTACENDDPFFDPGPSPRALFDPGVESQDAAIAWLDSEWLFSGSTYAAGFLEAGRILADHVQAEPDLRQAQRLAFPLVFLHRHAIELMLKQAIHECRYQLGENDVKLVGHDLMRLWQDLRLLIERLPQVGATEPYLSELDRRIGELAAVDPLSFAFRYPDTRDGSKPIPEHIRGIDLPHFSDEVARVVAAIDGWLTGLYVYAEAQANAEYYYYNE